MAQKKATTKKSKSRRPAARRSASRAKRPTGRDRAPTRKTAARRNPKGLSEVDLSKLSPKAQEQIKRQLGQLDAAEQKAEQKQQPAQVKKISAKRRSLLARLGTRLRVLGQTKRYKISARNLKKAPRKVFKVRARHDTDAIAKARAQAGPGFDEFAIVAANPSKKHKTVKRRRNLFGLGVKAKKRRNTTIIKRAKYVVANPKRKTRRVAGRPLRRRTNLRRRNPSVKKLVSTFYGRPVERVHNVKAPDRTPSRVMDAGPIVELVYGPKHQRLKFGDGKRAPRLLVRPDGKQMYFGGDSYAISAHGDLGDVHSITYGAKKRHLGNRYTHWTHHFGEETNVKPRLFVDEHGHGHFRGGQYYVRTGGVHN